ncbi:hypothetical protein A2V82_10695 [candidate division KSB1 bacterium RBG_16_48_16]|nr:MAG: hypothetical protein A2V82_10695 [candidate division KSB1 bacterium RBG_16_48_16]
MKNALIDLLSFLVVLLLLWFSAIHASSPEIDTTIYRNEQGKRILVTHRLKSAPPKIDGRLNDPCWQEGAWSGSYRQQMPVEGAKPSAETALKILYDDANIYFAIYAFDDPTKIDHTAGRRDEFEGDIVGVCFDSYFDHRTGFEFDLTAAGSKIDLVLMNDGWDTNWDAVWEGKTAAADSGWIAEFRVPLSQLRYANKETQIWGLHAWRWINRNQEEDQWALIPRNTPARMADIGELHGLSGLPGSRRIELLPYVRGQIHTMPKEKGNPFQDGSETSAAFGLDGKLGLSSNFTVDFTINPDFGQVEADPSVLNLTVFETFYEEKRPFFVEGKNIFDFEFDHELVFYSRRIGHRPSYDADLNDNEYADIPDNTSILGATKISGKSNKGLSVGILESVTAQENSEIQTDRGRVDRIAEPLSSYFVGRLQQDINSSNTIIGGIFTAINRRIDKEHLHFLNRSAYTCGFDLRHYWHDKTYYLDAKTLFSALSGEAEAILDAQLSSVRYYQRTDADYVEVDSSRTHLTGHGGYFEFGRGGNGNLRFETVLNWRSPGLEINDLGYQQRADEIELGGEIGYVENRPKWIFREYSLFLGAESDWNFAHTFMGSRMFFNCRTAFNNRWHFDLHVNRNNSHLDMRHLRGGPLVRLPGNWDAELRMSSDFARKLGLGFGTNMSFSDDGLGKAKTLSFWSNYKISSKFQLSSDADFSQSVESLEYMTTINALQGNRYILGQLNRKTLSMTLRLKYAITPELTLQYYGNPYVSIGDYSHAKKVVDPRAKHSEQLYHTFTGDELCYQEATNEYGVDENRDGVCDYAFSNNDFTFREFRSNFVLRWEFSPGSTFYLVWTHGRSIYSSPGDLAIGRGLNTLFGSQPENVYLFKLNYWFSI